ncbi:MAG: hypothetical protein DRP08_04830 [Candidatus Aenigmatarchaeota archaeon]|nr:MAG: hypothetical protein DRP08_04830 [Candidatus Aenigmarchaeota archaeon]
MVVGAGRQIVPVEHDAVSLVGFPGVADGVVEVWPFLRFVLGFEEVADGAEAAGVGDGFWVDST